VREEGPHAQVGFAWLQRACEERATALVDLKVEPALPREGVEGRSGPPGKTITADVIRAEHIDADEEHVADRVPSEAAGVQRANGEAAAAIRSRGERGIER